MKMNKLNGRSPWIGIFCITLVLVLIMAASAWAQEAQKKFPTGPVKIVCAQKAGGSNDTVSRTFAPFFSKYLNTPVVVENVEGAGGKIGRTQVYKAKPDGYTLILTGLPASYLGQKLENPEYKLELMTPIYNVSGGDYNATAVLYDSPVKTLEDLKKLGQTKSVKIAGTGLGNNSHLTYFFLLKRVGINCTFVPYDSSAEASLAVISKQCEATTGSIVVFERLEKQRQIRVISTNGPKRSPAYPDMPTLIELGYAGCGFDITLAIYGPPGIPQDIQKILEDAAAKAVADPAFAEMAKKAEFTPGPYSSREMKQMMEEQGKMLDEVVPEMKEAMKAGKKN